MVIHMIYLLSVCDYDGGMWGECTMKETLIKKVVVWCCIN